MDAPEPPRAAVALGPARQALWAQLRALPDDALAGLGVTANREILVVLGASEQLPWTAGIAYAAPCPEAPSLWLPTTQRPSLPLDLIEQALRARHCRSPVLLWPQPAWVLPLDRQLPASAAVLDRMAGLWH